MKELMQEIKENWRWIALVLTLSIASCWIIPVLITGVAFVMNLVCVPILWASKDEDFKKVAIAAPIVGLLLLISIGLMIGQMHLLTWITTR